MCSQNVLRMNHCCPYEQGILKLLSGVQFRDTSWSKNWRGDRTSQNHPLGLCGVLNERPTRKEPPATHWVRPLQKIMRKPWAKMQRQKRMKASGRKHEARNEEELCSALRLQEPALSNWRRLSEAAKSSKDQLFIKLPFLNKHWPGSSFKKRKVL